MSFFNKIYDSDTTLTDHIDRIIPLLCEGNEKTKRSRKRFLGLNNHAHNHLNCHFQLHPVKPVAPKGFGSRPNALPLWQRCTHKTSWVLETASGLKNTVGTRSGKWL